MLARTVLSHDVVRMVLKGTVALFVVLFMVYATLRLEQGRHNQQTIAQLTTELNALKTQCDVAHAAVVVRLDGLERTVYGDLLFKPSTSTTTTIIRPSAQDRRNDADLRQRLSRLEWAIYRLESHVGVP